ncbi:LPXTG cell wall anchor domain-containing protein [Enterococcus faecalis]|uniref:LPXTG cell wall anchor domain-containing protein n=1 Tax=Enterococcus faecalis TaxID=1351 RepID=UPI0013876486|nr:LPXTG cell wall anchor domain-containing protein [Enterococcus faecalis]MEB7427877.1 LPXTG cell wall anchor domain-containing protein [Enterococcus faecalis]
MKKIVLSSAVLLSFVFATMPIVQAEALNSSTSSTESITKTTISSTKTSTSSSTSSSKIKNSTSKNESSTTSSSEPTKKIAETSSKDSSTSNSESTVKQSETSTSDSSSVTSETSTSSSQEKTITLSATNKSYSVVKDWKLSKNVLLRLANYSGDKNNLDVKITNNKYAYISKNAQISKVYHTDLDALLGTANLENIKIMTIDDAQRQGLHLGEGNSDKNVEVINRSLPGEYVVTFIDYNNNLQATSIVTIGSPAEAVKDDQSTPTPTTSSSTETSNSKNAQDNFIGTGTSSTTSNPTQVLPSSTLYTSYPTTLPRTGEKQNNPVFVLIGVILGLSSVAVILYRKSNPDIN